MRGDFDEDEFDDDDFDDGLNVCARCDGLGGYHDCGEDVCCCANPEDEDSPDWVTCERCDGLGV